MTPPNDSGQPSLPPAQDWMIALTLDLVKIGAAHATPMPVILATIKKHAPALPVSRKEEKTERSPKIQHALDYAEYLGTYTLPAAGHRDIRILAAEVRRLESHSQQLAEVNVRLKVFLGEQKTKHEAALTAEQQRSKQLAEERDQYKREVFNLQGNIDAMTMHENEENKELSKRILAYATRLTAATKERDDIAVQLTSCRSSLAQAVDHGNVGWKILETTKERLTAATKDAEQARAVLCDAMGSEPIEGCSVVEAIHLLVSQRDNREVEATAYKEQLSAAHKTAARTSEQVEGLREALESARDELKRQRACWTPAHFNPLAVSAIDEELRRIEAALAQSSASSTTEAQSLGAEPLAREEKV